MTEHEIACLTRAGEEIARLRREKDAVARWIAHAKQRPHDSQEALVACLEDWIAEAVAAVEGSSKLPTNSTPRPPLQPLSAAEQDARRPPPPAVLADARQDGVHRDVGKSRPARSTKVRPKEGT
jgi:hypothetical protein